MSKHPKLEASKILARGDPHSVAQPGVFVTDHMSLEWTIDMELKRIEGVAKLTLRRTGPGDRVFLDVEGLEVKDLYVRKEEPLSYAMIKTKNAFGGSLMVLLDSEGKQDEAAEQSYELTIEYATVPECSALQWLSGEQTLGRKHPFMFSQCQAIHARALLPCQDTPSVKFTFDARVKVKSPHANLRILMGANESFKEGEWSCFRQTSRVPAYLVAIAVGNLEGREIGPRSTVWTEPEQLDAAAYEFAETESFLKTAEELAGPYRWGRYDLLVLPPSFPYGGMENPCLTFLSSSLLAGDRSLADVVAHEIAHSWTGNLVTNRSWEHFWLNEGWTMFLERKITGKLKGEAYRHFDALLGLNDLRDSVRHMTERGIDTALFPDLHAVHPDDAFSTVPYEKGHTLLFCLEQAISSAGGNMDDFVKCYVDFFAGDSLDVSDFITFVTTWCQERDVAIPGWDWEKWILGSGMPKDLPKYDETMKRQCLETAEKIVCGIVEPLTLAPAQAVYVLDALLEKDLSSSMFEQLEAAWKLVDLKNVEIRQKYLLLAVRLGVRFQEALEFAGLHGRMKYHRPIYQALYAQSRESREMAVHYFKNHAHKYHPIARKLIEKDLHLSD